MLCHSAMLPSLCRSSGAVAVSCLIKYFSQCLVHSSLSQGDSSQGNLAVNILFNIPSLELPNYITCKRGIMVIQSGAFIQDYTIDQRCQNIFYHHERSHGTLKELLCCYLKTRSIMDCHSLEQPLFSNQPNNNSPAVYSYVKMIGLMQYPAPPGGVDSGLEARLYNSHI